MTKALTTYTNSYDFVKTFAVITMIIDHAGAFLFPGHEWLHVIGRLSFPVWFFLIGYARSRDMSAPLWIGAGIMIASDLIVTSTLFPLNALVSILFIRFVLDSLGQFMLRGLGFFVLAVVILVAAIEPTFKLFDYGAQALIMAVFGYFVRRKEQINDRMFMLVMLTISAGSYAAFQHLIFDFSVMQTCLMMGGIIGLHFLLLEFKPESYEELDAVLPKPVKAALQFCGRHTLPIYVVHYIAFKYYFLYSHDALHLTRIDPAILFLY